jgi:hypothetical protein
MTLAQLASFMSKELGACAAINFDGGGSSAMWAGGKLVNRPSDGSERRVANHLAVVLRDDFVACDAAVEARATERRLSIKTAAAPAAATKPAPAAATGNPSPTAGSVRPSTPAPADATTNTAPPVSTTAPPQTTTSPQ